MPPKRPLVYAIDFDETIHDRQHPAKGRRMGPPLPGAKEALIGLNNAGHRIIIHSCNRPEVIRKWMEFFNVPFDKIWGESPEDHGKPIADWYIDDRSITFNDNWPELVAMFGI